MKSVFSWRESGQVRPFAAVQRVRDRRAVAGILCSLPFGGDSHLTGDFRKEWPFFLESGSLQGLNGRCGYES